MTDQNATQQLQSYIPRIEALEDDKKTIADEIKAIYAEAQSNGLDPKIMRKLIAIRKKDEREREEEDMILDSYAAAMGMLPGFEREAAE